MGLVRYAGNPVFEPQADSEAYDYGKVFCQVLKFGDTDYRCWYSAGDDSASVVRRPAYATSTDGIIWTKPNLGLVSIGGNTNNNTLLDNLNRFSNLTYWPDRPAASRYLMTLEFTQSANDYGIHIWASSDGINFTLLKTVVTATAFGTSCEGKALARRPDGRYVAYYTTGHSADLRNIGAYVSDTSDITGTWTHVGPVIANTSTADERYGIAVQDFGSNGYLGYVMGYSAAAEQTWMNLYRSSDCLNWSLVTANWLVKGASAQWDDELIFNGGSLVADGANWRFYYVGMPDNHAAASPRKAQIGYATITNTELLTYFSAAPLLSDNLSAYYSLGSVVADAGSLNLTNNGTATFVAGKVGNAANFVAASTQYLSRADNALLDFGDIDFTITGWFKLTTKPGASMIALSKFVSTGNQRGYQLQWSQATDRFIFQISPDGATATAVNATATIFGAPATGTWYFVVMRYNTAANVMSISVNAGTPNFAAEVGGAFANTAAFEIGRLGNATNYWDGMVDEVGIFKRLLSDLEVSTLYSAGNGYGYSQILNPPATDVLFAGTAFGIGIGIHSGI